MPYNQSVILAVLTAATMFSARQLIHIFQLEGYHYKGYIKWCKKDAVEKYLFDLLLPCAAAQILMLLLPLTRELLGFTVYNVVYNWYVLPALVFVVLSVLYILKYKKTTYKKPLVYTARIKRLYVALFVVSLVLNALFVTLNIPFISYVLLPLYVLLAALLINPVEIAIRNKFVAISHKKLMNMPLVRIGITGSYGKTSTKFILGTLLAQKYRTLVTPASFNTPNGISRCINENLEEGTEVFVSEMGAAHNGDIAKLCRIVEPMHGILTSVGEQHLETFGSLENIKTTKYALIDALPEGGYALFNANNENCMELYTRECKAEKLLYGLDRDDTLLSATDLSVSVAGSSFTLTFRDRGISLPCTTALLGRHNILNILGAATLAYKLGVTPEQLRDGIQALEPTEHRLQLIRGANGVNVIDDAFNSNPAGALEAVRTLSAFTSGKRIMITPGMVELGPLESVKNAEFGKQAAQYCDIVILVGINRTQPILEGLLEGGMTRECIYSVNSLDEATQVLGTFVTPGDTVLFENDLPDNYN